MKRLAFLFVLAMIAGSIFAEKQVATQASEVTIFMNGAQVTRQKNIQLSQGKQTLVFNGLSPYIRDNSIQVGAEGKITILGVKREYDFSEQEKQSERIAQLESQIKDKELEISKIKTEQEVIKAEQDFLEANKVLSGKNEAVTLQNLQQTLTYYRERLNATKTRQGELTLSLKERNDELTKLKADLRQVQGNAAKETSKIIVDINAQQVGTFKFNLTYYVNNVNWIASYDLRAFSIGEPIALTYKAQIFQNTGENWDNVSLTLSSGNPSVNNNKPTLSTYKLREPQKEYAVVGYGVTPKALMVEEELAYDAAPMMKSAARSYAANNVIETEVSDNMTSFEIKIKEKYSVPSSGERTTVDVGVFELPSEYEYHAIPKKDKDAFLIAKATDWTKHHLINGQANIYFENTYVGQTSINTQSANDTLVVSLGRDKSIVVTRDEQTDFAKKKILSSKVEVTKAWQIEVKNQKKRPIDIIIFDQIPVSSTSSIEVSSEVNGAELKASTGEINWKLNVPAGQTMKKTFNYKVKYPKDWDLKIE